MRRKAIKITKKNAIIAGGVAIIVGICAIFGYNSFSRKKAAMSDFKITLDTVTRGDIEVVITGEASVEPYERYEIISMVSGDILSSPYEVGDIVNEGDILYQFDTSEQESNLRKQELSLQQSQNNLANAKEDLRDARSNLVITAPNNGIISDLNIKVGSSVSNNQVIATVENTSDMEVSLPFTKAQIDSMYIGQNATISSSVHMSTVTGKVRHISTHPTAQSDGSNVYNVTIKFKNPGALTEGVTVGGTVGDMASPGYGTVKCTESGSAKAEASGTTTSVNYSNGDYVTKGAAIATISSDSISTHQRSVTSSELNLKNAELSMQDTKDALDDYSIKSPISGTVITKNAKAGDTLDKTNSSTALMVVADISKLKFSLEIDELDVNSVNQGQMVSITCDALPDESFVGEITSVSVEGTATNGVTTYTAEVVINEPGNLRPSMNIDASVIIDSATDVLMIPSADIKTAMGVSYVFLKDETGERGATEEDFENAMKGNSNEPKNLPQKENGKKGDNNSQKSRLPEAPKGFVVAIVETGLSDDDYTQIKSGLNEFDEIQQLSVSSDTSTNMMEAMMGGMGGNMHGGMSGMPSGGTMPHGMR